MFKYYSSFLLYFIVSLQVSKGQSEQRLDSLFKLLKESNVDTLQLRLNHQIGNLYSDNNPTKALEYYDKALKIGQQLNEIHHIANAYYSIGYCFLLKRDWEKSIESYLEATKIYEKLDYRDKMANTYMSLISVYSEMNNFTKVKEYIQKSEACLINSKDTFQLCSLYSQIGSTYSRNGEQDSAFKYLHKGLQLARSSRDTYQEIVSLSNLSLVFKKLFKTELALAYCDSVERLINNADEYIIELAANYNNKACIYSQSKNFQAALPYFQKSISLGKKIGQIGIEMENYRNLSDMYENMGNYKEYAFYLKKYTQIKDSLFTEDTRNQINQLETDYIVGKKNNEILKKDVSIQQQMNQRNIFIMLSVGALLFLGVALYFNQRIQKRKKEVEAQNALIGQQKDELQNLNQVKDRMFSVISHDLRNPLNNLHSCLILSENENLSLEKRKLFKDQSIQSVAQTGILLDNLLTWAKMQLKDSSPTLRPLSVNETVQDCLDLLKPQAIQKNIEFFSQVEQAKIIGDENILSIAMRNILTNAIKFSPKDSSIKITGCIRENLYHLSVQDTGPGLSETQIKAILNSADIQTSKGSSGESGSGLGLFLVKQVLHKMESHLLIESQEGQGAIFTVIGKLG
jgi:two-component system sensor histidine kinase/response regulator